MKSYNIIFAGTPQFSVSALSALIHSRHTVKAVYTQPDRPAGRGRKLTASPVKEVALQYELPLYQPLSLRNEVEQKIITALDADLMIVVAYGLILPLAVLQAPRLGCLNIHASLLPRWRGAAPIQRAILEGDETTGITIMQMNEGLDTGDMLFKAECPIQATATSARLHDELAAMGAEALLKTLDQLSSITPEAQDNALANYAHKITKEEARLDWNLPAIQLDRAIRAFNPWPISFTQAGETVVRIWEASVIEQALVSTKPGTIVKISAEGIDVATGENVLRIKAAQLPGGRVVSAGDLGNVRESIFEVGVILMSRLSS